MKHTKEEIINALKVIKDECRGTSCVDCSLGNNVGDCRISARSPEHWEIAELPPPEKWRALK